MMKRHVFLFLLTLLLLTASCKKSEVAGNQTAADGNASAPAGSTSSTPPFATKEPERYQAVRIITSSEGGETTLNGEAGSRTLIARDGNRRREDYEAAAGEKISYLQLPEGIYVLMPSKKLYAEVTPEMSGAAGATQTSVPPDFSPDKLLNETRPESRYEKLGAEDLNGRATMKYRVVVGGKTGAAKEVKTESVVWVDESLGMPVKTETTSTDGAGSWAKMTMELRDIKDTVDAGMFELPTDYRKVEARELFVYLNQASGGGKGRE
jgi:outer membrane lipoprotein-sorting protein